jgi:hypothetical protein
MTLPNHLRGGSTSNNAICDVMHNDEKVFVMQYCLAARWTGMVPIEHQMSFLELLKSSDLSASSTEGIIGSCGLVFQLIQNIPVERSVAELALQRIANSVGHPYDLRTIRIALGDSKKEGES